MLIIARYRTTMSTSATAETELVLVGTHGKAGTTHAARTRRFKQLGGRYRTAYFKVCTGKESPNGEPVEGGDPAQADCSPCRRELAK